MTRMSLNIAADLLRHSPMRPVDWRWQCALELIDGCARVRPDEDRWVKLAVSYQRAVNAANTGAKCRSLCRRMPEMVYAHRLYDEGGLSADEITARLLAGESFTAISGRTGVPPSVIETFEAVFFNVAEAVSRGAHDWLLTSAVGIGPWREPCIPSEAQTWRFLGLVGGPFVVDLVIADYLKRDEPRIDDRELLARKGRFLAKEFACGSSPEMTKAILDEGCRLFHDALVRQMKTDPLFRAQMNLLRCSAGLESLSATEEAPRQDADAPAQPRKDVPHEATQEQ